MAEQERERRHTARRGVGAVVLVVVTLTVAWWAVTRATAGARSLTVHETAGPIAAAGGGAPVGSAGSLSAAHTLSSADTLPADTLPADTLRVLTWNIAHGRGDRPQGPLENFNGGDEEARTARLARIAGVIRRADADIVVLNEVDFDATWSGGINQADVLARAAGYPVRVQQRNFDFGLAFADFAFGNVLLTRLPLRSVRPVPLPPHARWEALLIGAKTAAVAELQTGIGPVAVVPIHLEFRDEATRLAAVPALTALQRDAPPLLLAGDFNTSPPGWPFTDSVTAVGRLLDAGWSSPRATGADREGALTFPSPAPRTAIDWILAEPPLHVIEARVLTATPELSDHLPVLATVVIPARR